MSVMENPSDTLEQNVEALATEMIALKYFSCRVVRKEPKRMEGWLESIESAMAGFDRILVYWNDVKRNKLKNSSYSVWVNGKVIESLKVAIALKEDIKAIMESIEPLANQVKTDNPKVKVVTPSKKDIETSLTEMKRDKIKLEVVTPLKKVMEASVMKIVKPMHFTPAEIRRFTMDFSNEPRYDQIGDVFKGRFSSGQQIFVTVLKEMDNIEENLFMAEVNKMFRISHKNMVKLYGFCFHQKIKAVVHEYVDNGSLDEILYYRDDIVWEKLYEIAVQTAMGLSYLHDGFHEPIVLGDFNTSNVLLDSNFSPKVTHFRVKKLMDRTTLFRLDDSINKFSLAPEVWLRLSQITHKCDVYSFGIMLTEILERRKMKDWPDEWAEKRIWHVYQNGQLDELVDEWAVGDKNRGKAKVMYMVALWCIQITPEIRPPMSTVVKMLTMEIPVVTPPYPFL